MLETKDLVKIYKPKKGVPVTALNKISLTFPEKGMVFLLGKSGSGKSTLLNVLGGLDKYDSGEITIKGVSSKNFKQQHFDSYRNTYVGFIFQEYNVLDEFSVGANIALAIELQNRKATDEEINKILKEVDLEGFANRKPNELSGGQKQRVAIARALVKNPEIIMADEPTGALDSNTGKQVFDTLKSLSKDKLVIIVSHDREFSEQYADRIIELADGNVISDVEIDNKFEENDNSSITFEGNTVSISGDYHLTEDDRKSINEYIDRINSGELKLSISGKKTTEKHFKQTDTTNIKKFDSSSFKLIKSKLPLKNAFKIGASGLKHKKIRLVITILLCCISFGLFGLADTFGSYNHIKTCTNSIYDTKVNYASVQKEISVGSGIEQYWNSYGRTISKEDLIDIEKNFGQSMTPVYIPYNSDFSFTYLLNPDIKLSETSMFIHRDYFSGFSEITDKTIKDNNFKILSGVLPDGTKDEIAISKYTYEVFKKGNIWDGTTTKFQNGTEKNNYIDVKDYSDVIGKEIKINSVKYKITAIIDTNFDITRFKSLIVKDESKTTADSLVDYVLYNEFNSIFEKSLSGTVMVGEGKVQGFVDNRPLKYYLSNGNISYSNEKDQIYFGSEGYSRLQDVKNEKITWLNGEKTSLKDNEIIISSDMVENAIKNQNEKEETINSEDDEVKTAEQIKTSNYDKIKNTLYHQSAYYNMSHGEFKSDETDNVKIVGVLEVDEKNKKYLSTTVINDELFNKMGFDTDGLYAFAVGKMPSEKTEIEPLVKYSYREGTDTRFALQNPVTYELNTVNEALKTLSKIFLYIGLGFALFAALMLANFIGTSINYKKQEIGILRAIGSRSNDVFRIFFSESFIIAMINFVLASIGVFIATTIINSVLRTRVGVLITVLHFAPRQIVLLLAVSLLVAFIASFLPVKKIASKRPIDAIRNR